MVRHLPADDEYEEQTQPQDETIGRLEYDPDMGTYESVVIRRVKGDPANDPAIVTLRLNGIEQLIRADTGVNRTVLGEPDFDAIAKATGAKLRPTEMRLTPYATTDMPTPQKLPVKGLSKLRIAALDGAEIETEVVVVHGEACLLYTSDAADE